MTCVKLVESALLCPDKNRIPCSTYLYEHHHGIKPEIDVALLFYNAKRDCLKLFFRDALGSSELQKMVPRGGFMLPAPLAGQEFLEISPHLVTRLFRG